MVGYVSGTEWISTPSTPKTRIHTCLNSMRSLVVFAEVLVIVTTLSWQYRGNQADRELIIPVNVLNLKQFYHHKRLLNNANIGRERTVPHRVPKNKDTV